MGRENFLDRLVEQKMQLFRLNIDYERKQHQIHSYKDEAIRLATELKEAEEHHNVVETLRKRLEELNKESEERYNAAQAEDQKEREAAAAELRAEMANINDAVEEISAAEMKAKSDKQILSKKLEILSQYKNQGNSKFDEALKERDERVAKLRQSLEAQIAVKPQVEELIEKVNAKLQESRPQFEDLKAKVEEKKNFFDELRAQLDQSKQFYDEASALRDRQKKTLESIQNDIELAVSRLENTQTECATQKRRIANLEEKIDSTLHQVIVLTKTTNRLLGIEDPEEQNTAEEQAGAAEESAETTEP